MSHSVCLGPVSKDMLIQGTKTSKEGGGERERERLSLCLSFSLSVCGS